MVAWISMDFEWEGWHSALIWLKFHQDRTKGERSMKRKRGTGPVSSRYRSAFVAGFPLGWPESEVLCLCVRHWNRQMLQFLTLEILLAAHQDNLIMSWHYFNRFCLPFQLPGGNGTLCGGQSSSESMPGLQAQEVPSNGNEQGRCVLPTALSYRFASQLSSL